MTVNETELITLTERLKSDEAKQAFLTFQSRSKAKL